MNEQRERYSYADISIRGNAGRDGELRYTPAGKAVLQVGIAISKGTKEKPRTVWLTLKAFGELAEQTRIAKGDKVQAHGYLDIAEWTDKRTGLPKERVEVIASEIRVEPRGQRQATQAQSFDPFDDVPF